MKKLLIVIVYLFVANVKPAHAFYAFPGIELTILDSCCQASCRAACGQCVDSCKVRSEQCSNFFTLLKNLWDYAGHGEFRKNFPCYKALTNKQIDDLRLQTDRLKEIVYDSVERYQAQYCLNIILEMLEIVEKMPVQNGVGGRLNNDCTMLGEYLKAQKIELANQDPFGKTPYSLASEQAGSSDSKAPTLARARDLLKVLAAAGVAPGKAKIKPGGNRFATYLAMVGHQPSDDDSKQE